MDHHDAFTEVEGILRGHERIRDAALAMQRTGDTNTIVAYVVPEGGAIPTVSQLREYLQGRVPSHLVPAAFVSLERMPVTGDGAIDRQRLPQPPAPVRPDDGHTPPRCQTEAEICAIWTDILMVDRVGIHDDFLDLGGDSLIATQIVARIWDVFSIEIPLEALFEQGTVAGVMEQYFADALTPTEGA